MSNLLELPPFSEAERWAARNLASLTPKELKVAQCLLNGGTNKEIGIALGNSPRTIEVHRSRVFEKLGIHSKTELLRIAVAAAQHSPGSLSSGRAPAALSDTVNEDLDLLASFAPSLNSRRSARLPEIVKNIGFGNEAKPDSINVYLTRDGHGRPAGFILASEPSIFELRVLSYPALNILRPPESAIAYGLFLALLLDLPLNVTGERTLWEPHVASVPSGRLKH